MIGTRVGARIGSRFGSSIGVGVDELGSSGPAVTMDAARGVYRPANVTEAAALQSYYGLASGFASPDNIYNCQEASGNLADTGAAGLALATQNSPLYRQAVPGCSFLAVAANGSTAGRFSVTMPDDIATTAVLFGVYVYFTPSQVSVLNMTADGNATATTPATANAAQGKIRIRTGSNFGDTVNFHSLAMHPMFVLFDPVNSRNVLYTDLEKLPITFAASSGTTFMITCGLAGDAVANAMHLWVIRYKGVNAQRTDAEIKAYLQALGFSIPWS